MFKSTGIIEVFEAPFKVWLRVDPEISRYYRSQIPFPHNRPRYPAHLSVIRNIPFIEQAMRFHGKVVEIEYDQEIFEDETYYWLACSCLELEKLREFFGLSPVEENVTCSPDKRHRWHITIANKKGFHVE